MPIKCSEVLPFITTTTTTTASSSSSSLRKRLSNSGMHDLLQLGDFDIIATLQWCKNLQGQLRGNRLYFMSFLRK